MGNANRGAFRRLKGSLRPLVSSFLFIISDCISPETVSEKVHRREDYKQLARRGQEMAEDLDKIDSKLAETSYQLDRTEVSLARAEYANLGLKNAYQDVKAEADAAAGVVESVCRENAQLRKAAFNAKDLASKVLRIAREIASAKDIKNLRAQAINEREQNNWAATSSLVEWQNTVEGKLVDRAKSAESLADAYRREGMAVAMDIVVGKFQRVPFVYYDFVSKRVIPTRAARKLMGFNDDAQYTLWDLIKYIGKEGRAELVASLREGTKMKHYDVQSTGKKSIKLSLTTEPFIYRDHPIGVGIFLEDKGLSERAKVLWMGRTIKNVFEAISDRYRNFEQAASPQAEYVT